MTRSPMRCPGEPGCSSVSILHADPARCDERAIVRSGDLFKCLAEVAWRAGRVSIVSEISHDPHSDPTIAVRLALGTFGPKGTSAAEVGSLESCAEEAIELGGLARSRPSTRQK